MAWIVGGGLLLLGAILLAGGLARSAGYEDPDVTDPEQDLRTWWPPEPEPPAPTYPTLIGPGDPLP